MATLAAVACSGPADEASVQTQEQAWSWQPAPAGPLTREVALEFLPGTDAQTSVLRAAGTLRLADGVRLVDANGEPANVTNTGSGSTELGASAAVGNLTSRAGVTLRSNSQVFGTLRTAQQVSQQAGANVEGDTETGVVFEAPPTTRFTVAFPTTEGSVSLEPDVELAVSPGSYQNLVVKSRSRLLLRAGSYYARSLVLEPQGKLVVDASDGPVVLWVAEQLNYKGAIEGDAADAAFFLGYLGSNAISVEAAFAGTLVAPAATLRLAPLNGAAHRGSFIAKSIDAAEAWTTLHFVPFAHWPAVFHVQPHIHCVQRYAADHAAVLFGFDNLSDYDVEVPLGPSNSFDEITDYLPPRVLHPGSYPRGFWGAMRPHTPLGWNFGGQRIEASPWADLPPCGPDDHPPEAAPVDPSAPVRIETPSTLPQSVLDAVPADFDGAAFSSIIFTDDAPSFFVAGDGTTVTSDGEFGTIGQALTGVSSDGLFTVKITKLSFDDSEGLCGTVDPFTRIRINGGDSQETGNAEALVPRAQVAVDVKIEVWDDDSFLCFGDDRLKTIDLTVDNLVGEESCTEDNKVCWTITGTASLPLCFGWNADYIDSSPGGASAPLHEDFARGLGQGGSRQAALVEASYAYANIDLISGADTTYHFQGVLDVAGCVPEEQQIPQELLHDSRGYSLVRRVVTAQCYDQGGSNCAQGLGLQVLTFPPSPDPKVKDPSGAIGQVCIVTTHGENAGEQPPGCDVRPQEEAISSQMSYLQLGVRNDATRVAATVSHILRRDSETSGGLGIATVLEELGAQSSGLRIGIHSGTYCGICQDGSPSPACADGSEPLWTSCREGGANTLLIQPDDSVPGGVPGTGLASSRFKYVIAHEFGHFIQSITGGIPDRAGYGVGPGEPGAPAMCACSHVETNQQLHCLQSLEDSEDSQVEGFAQFFAARVWNRELEDDCSFVYYKPFLDAKCMTGTEDCQDHPTFRGANDVPLKVSQPPFAVDCKQAVRWRNAQCASFSGSLSLINFGTEYDWMTFYYGLTDEPNPGRRLTMDDISGVYRTACGGSPCDRFDLVTWSGTSMTNDLSAAAVGYFGADIDKRDGFLSQGVANGVTDDLSP